MVSLEESQSILSQQVEKLAQQFSAVYSNYLAALAATVQEQLIQAGYQLCTQIYPEQFVALEEEQQRSLQQHLRQLGQKTVANLTVDQLLEAAKKRAIAEAEVAEQLAQTASEASEAESDKSAESPESEPVTAPTAPAEATAEQAEQPESAVAELDLSYLSPVPPAHPAAIYAWLQSLNRSLVRQLRHTSRQANRLLEKMGIIRSGVPPQMLEAAIKNDGAEQQSGPPNLLMLTITTAPSEEREEEEGTTIQLAAIYLRLADLEFSVPELRLARQQLRDCQRQLKQLGRLVAAEEQRQAIAQAEAAWRFAWNQDR
ncbi:hypothetical protein [Synechococcus elongatus]|uniref:Primosomal protein n=1 Tax=Synechococcus elongatus PCC 11802 TaxID=2283154 RepID=A0AAU6R4R8_SYNEL|nr:hypothetical protein [Synechococcus elongatus]QFZ92663.1 hypothetical protein EKO22_10245 [Synechococcus elongatus PCC 11802]